MAKSRFIKILFAFIGPVLSIGCANGISIKSADSTKNEALKGVPWNLPMTRFNITITRHVTKCGRNPEVKIETLASATTVLDQDKRYVLTSNGWFSTSDIKSTLTTAGYNSALNAESTDETAAIIGNIIGTAAKVALIAAAGKDPNPLDPHPSPTQENCQTTVANAVRALYPDGGPTLKSQVDQAIATLARRTADVAVLSAKSNVEPTNASLKARLVRAIAHQDQANRDLVGKQNALSTALKVTTNVQTVTWPSQASELRMDDGFEIDKTIRDKWLTQGIDDTEFRDKLKVYLALMTPEINPEAFHDASDVELAKREWITPAPPIEPDVKNGLPVRLPREAMLLMCTHEPCPESLQVGESLGEKRSAVNFPVLQIGPVYLLPVSGGMFRSQSVAVSVNESGIPTVMQTSEKVAAGKALTAAAKDAATQLAEAIPATRAAELARTKSQTDQINANLALQTARQTTGIQGETSILTSQTALVNAQLAHSTAQHSVAINAQHQQASGLTAQAATLQAQAALVTAQANSQVIDQSSALAAQATLINAETALLNASAALVKAQTPALP